MPVGLILSDVESDGAVGSDDIARCHDVGRIAVALVGERPRLAYHQIADVEQQLAGRRVDRQAIDATERHANRPPVGARGDHEVVLEASLVAVVHDVDAGVRALVGDASVGRDP
ncbi:MAG: hypothetical protein ABI833_11070, partial [Acidobacteriota bacterium]